MSACDTVVLQSISVSNHPDTCDSPHVTNLALDVVSIATIILHLKSYLTLRII